MNDLQIVTNLESVKEYPLVFCGNDILLSQTQEFLEDSNFDCTQVSTPEQLSQREDVKCWFIVSMDYLDDWSDAISSRNFSDCRIATTEALGISLLLNVANPVFSDEFKEKLKTDIAEKRKAFLANTQGMLEELVLRDSDIEMVNEWKKSPECPVLAYGCAKVGTTTTYASLQALGINTRHLHSIRGDKIVEALKSLPRLKIITGVREPLAKELSTYFQSFIFTRYENNEIGLQERLDNCVHDTRIGMQQIFDYVPGNPYGTAFGWFDREIKENFGIDVYAEPFDKEKGYHIYRNGNVEVFLYRLENLNSLEKEIADFLERPDFKIVKANDASEKDIRFIYEDVKKTHRFSKALMDLYYKDNERMDFFYTKEEQEKFLKKWQHD